MMAASEAGEQQLWQLLMEAETEGVADEVRDGVLAPPKLIRNDDHDGDVDDDDDDREEDTAETETPIQLDENYYEIEAVRRKRVHKGQVQYLIKWRGWAETANTWEPLDNLLACPEVIDAFEESLRLGKHRKRKRKSGGSIIQPKKKKQQRFNPASNSNVPSAHIRNINKYAPSGLLNSMNLADPHVSLECSRPFGREGENHAGDVNSLETAMQANENGHVHSEERKVENELDAKLFELKGATSTYDGGANKFAVKLQETRGSITGCTADGLSKADTVELVQTNRCTGARRRKSGSVKRFKQDSVLCAPNETQDGIWRRMTIGSFGTAEWVQNPDSMVYDSPFKDESDDSRNKFSITEIIKPIGYSASVSNSVRDVSVTFIAMRSDGNEVTVDNKYLKANNPLLLINFYEQHLRYSSTPRVEWAE